MKLAMRIGSSVVAVLWALNFFSAVQAKENREFPVKKMVKELKLTDEQVKQIKTIHEANKPKFEASKEKMREARKTLHEDMAASASKSASDDQLRQKYEAVQSARQAMAKEHFEEVLQIRKVLTDEQRKDFRGMMGKHHGGHKGSKDKRDSDLGDD